MKLEEEWEELLTRLARCARLELDREHVIAVSRYTLPTAERGWSDALVLALSELGLRAEALSCSVGEAAEAVGPEHPVVGQRADGEGWVMLSDRRGRSLMVETMAELEPSWVRRGVIAELVHPTELGSVTWVAVDPPGPREMSAERLGGEHPSPFARLRALLRMERHDLLVVLTYAIGVGLLTLVTPVAVQALVNTVAFGTLLQPLLVLALLLLTGLGFAAVLRALQAWVVEVLQRRLFLHLVGDMAHRLPRVQLTAFDRAHGPELVNRFFDIFTLQKTSSSLLLGGLEVALTALVGMSVLAFYHPYLLAFDLLLVLLVLAILVGLGRGATKLAVEESYAKYDVAGWLEEVARHPAAFKLAGGPELARENADRLAATYLRRRRDHWRVVFRQMIGALALHAFASAGVLGIGGWLVIGRQLTLGQLVAAELIVTAVVAAFAKMAKHLETSYDLLAALDKIGQLLDLPVEPPATAGAAPGPAGAGSALVARGLELAYRGHLPTLRGVELSVAPGDRVAVSGPGGAGASTLIDVLAGLRAPDAGEVALDGVDIRDLHRGELRARVAVVRGPEVIVGTIADNVTFGRRAIDVPQVRSALAAVDLLDEIALLPEGLSTRITPSGSPLSSSQAARLTLARAIVGAPSLLLIDRAVDGLDDEARDHVLDAIFGEDAGWTLLLATRDEAVRARCARRLRLLDGALTEEGR